MLGPLITNPHEAAGCCCFYFVLCQNPPNIDGREKIGNTSFFNIDCKKQGYAFGEGATSFNYSWERLVVWNFTPRIHHPLILQPPFCHVSWSIWFVNPFVCSYAFYSEQSNWFCSDHCKCRELACLQSSAEFFALSPEGKDSWQRLWGQSGRPSDSSTLTLPFNNKPTSTPTRLLLRIWTSPFIYNEVTFGLNNAIL